MRNILSNAYKYTNPGGKVNMRLEEIPSDREGYALYQTTITDTGIGTAVTVTLPHKIVKKANLVTHAGVELDPRLFMGKHILLAEDNELNAEIAIELETSHPGYYNLILMDIQMPNMNGYEATQAIRALQDYAKANIPILAMTANAFEKDKREAYRSGMNGHVAKPINVRELMKELANLLITQ